MSAVSSIFSPASRQISTSRVASATSLDPQALKNSFPPPNVPVPKLRTGTFNPEPPNCRYSIFIPEFELAPELDAALPAPSRIKSIPATTTSRSARLLRSRFRMPTPSAFCLAEVRHLLEPVAEHPTPDRCRHR